MLSLNRVVIIFMRYRLMPLYVISYRLLCLCIVFYVSIARAQDHPLDVSIKDNTANLSGTQLLSRAENVREQDPDESLTLAKEALRLLNDSDNHQAIAQTHMLLAELIITSDDSTQSKQHFLQASQIYHDTDNKRSQLIASIDFAELLFERNAYNEGFNILEEFLPRILESGDDKLSARALNVKGEAYFEQEDYINAINTFTQALAYLTANDNKTVTNLGLTYHQIAQGHKKLKNYEQASAFHKQGLDAFKAAKNEELIARSYKNVAMAEHKLENYLASLDYLLKGIEIHSRLDEPKQLAELLMMAGIVYREVDRYDKALEYTHKSYLIARELNDIPRIAETSNQIGHLYTRLKKHNQARFFYQVTTDLPEDKVASKSLAAASREIAVIDYEAGEYQLAIRMALKAHHLYKKDNEKSKQSSTARIIGEIYRAENNSEQAINYFRESLTLANDVSNKKLQMKALNSLGRALIDVNTDEAIIHLKKSLKLSGKSGKNNDKISTYNALKKAEKKRGNFKEALHYSEEENELTKKLFEQKDKENLAKIKAKLDSHRIEIELESLRRQAKLDELEIIQKDNEIQLVKQTSRISELELTKNRYASFLLATLLAICLIAAIYIYRIFVVSKRHNTELNYLANRDPLTNCYNRRVLFDRMDQDFKNIEQLEEYSIIMADIDHFKHVNDTYGHNAGDKVLREFANILKDNVRQNDITVRYGGEEFCIILPGTNQQHALRITEAIRKKVEDSHFENIDVTSSFGVSSIKFNAKTPTELIEQADNALYASKANGRNQVTLWNPTIKKNSK